MAHTHTTKRTVVRTPLAPAAIGPYSQGILVGSTLYVSGQIALNPKFGSLVTGTVTDETERTLENLRAILKRLA